MGNPQNAPDYYYTFVDDAGRNWGQIGYYCGIRSEWVCLDQPSADYNTLYAIYPPQKVTKPEIQPVTEQATEPTTQPETEPATQPTTQPIVSDDIIKPSGISPAAILIAAAAVAAISAGLLVVLKKKKT